MCIFYFRFVFFIQFHIGKHPFLIIFGYMEKLSFWPPNRHGILECILYIFKDYFSVLSNDINLFFLFFSQRDSYHGSKKTSRSIAKKFGIPPTTFSDLIKRPKESDGYPNMGRKNHHNKLLTTIEERVSFYFNFYFILLSI